MALPTCGAPQGNHGLAIVSALLDGVRQPLPAAHHGVHIAAAQLAEEGLKLRQLAVPVTRKHLRVEGTLQQGDAPQPRRV